MPSTEIEQFAELLVQGVRDVAIASCDSAMRPNAKYALAKRWKAAIDGGDQADLVREVIPDAVDKAVCQLLRAIDEEDRSCHSRPQMETQSISRMRVSANWWAGTWGLGVRSIRKRDSWTIVQIWHSWRRSSRRLASRSSRRPHVLSRTIVLSDARDRTVTGPCAPNVSDAALDRFQIDPRE